MPGPARIRTEQRLEWADTDASGHHHHGAMLRMAAVAEAELLETLGLADQVYGRLPRVQVSLNLRRPVRFRARVDVELSVADMGRTSIAFDFTISTDAGAVADGRVVAVRVAADGRPVRWTERQRRLLTASGDVTAGRALDTIDAG